MIDPAMKAAYHEQYGGPPKHDAVDERFAAGWAAAIAEIEFAKHDAFNEGVSATEDWYYHDRAIASNPYPERPTK